MKVIKPIAVTDAMILSSTATEAYAAYNAATDYALNARVTYGNSVYESIQTPNIGRQPDTSPLYWTRITPTNKNAMFDSEISTQTVQASPLTVVLAPGYVNSLALLAIGGNTVQIDITNGASGPNVYSRMVTLDAAAIADWYQYFFEPSGQFNEIALTDLPPYSDARVTVSIIGSGSVKCGQISMGTFYELGSASFGATAGILDFSRKETNQTTGVTTFVRRAYSKRMSLRLMLTTAQISRVQRTLADLRATPAMWVADDDISTYGPLAVFGFYRDFSIEVAYPQISYCSLEIEGLT